MALHISKICPQARKTTFCLVVAFMIVSCWPALASPSPSRLTMPTAMVVSRNSTIRLKRSLPSRAFF